jgi:glycosyltransferase involved in cell wall biosynthesis
MGLVVTEANAMGTPAIGYDVPGLRDSIRHGETGITIREKTPAAMAQQAILLLRDTDCPYKYGRNALEFSRQFSLDNTANSYEKILNIQSGTNADVIMGSMSESSICTSERSSKSLSFKITLYQ